MNYVNPPSYAPAGVRHRTFFSSIIGHEIGYNIYLPDDYDAGEGRYPVEYHLHGWMCDESSDIGAMESVCRARRSITVFPNNSPNMAGHDDLPVENIVIEELISHIDRTYRTMADREHRRISGFSMGGGYAFVWALKHSELFSGVTAYAGTYHHYYHPDYETVCVDATKAYELHRAMIAEKKFDTGRFGPVNVIELVNRVADDIRGRLEISLHVGTEDVLYCDNEIMRLHLEMNGVPHEYVRYAGAAHCLADIV